MYFDYSDKSVSESETSPNGLLSQDDNLYNPSADEKANEMWTFADAGERDENRAYNDNCEEVAIKLETEKVIDSSKEITLDPDEVNDLSICSNIDACIDNDADAEKEEHIISDADSLSMNYAPAKFKTRRTSFVELIGQLDKSNRSKGINDLEGENSLIVCEHRESLMPKEGYPTLNCFGKEQHEIVINREENREKKKEDYIDCSEVQNDESFEEILQNGVTNLEACENDHTLPRFPSEVSTSYGVRHTSEYYSVSSDFSSLNTTSSVFSSVFGGSSNTSEYKRGLSIQSDAGFNEGTDQLGVASVNLNGDEKQDEAIGVPKSSNHLSVTSSDSDQIEVGLKSSSSSTPPSPYSPSYLPILDGERSRSSSPANSLPIDSPDFPFVFYSQPTSLELYPPEFKSPGILNSSCPDLQALSLEGIQEDFITVDKNGSNKRPDKFTIHQRRAAKGKRKLRRSISVYHPPKSEFYPRPKSVLTGLNCTDLQYNLNDFEEASHSGRNLNQCAPKRDESAIEIELVQMKKKENECNDIESIACSVKNVSEIKSNDATYETNAAANDKDSKDGELATSDRSFFSISSRWMLPFKNFHFRRDNQSQTKDNKVMENPVSQADNEQTRCNYPVIRKSNHIITDKIPEETTDAEEIWNSQGNSMRDSGYGTTISELASPCSEAPDSPTPQYTSSDPLGIVVETKPADHSDPTTQNSTPLSDPGKPALSDITISESLPSIPRSRLSTAHDLPSCKVPSYPVAFTPLNSAIVQDRLNESKLPLHLPFTFLIFL